MAGEVKYALTIDGDGTTIADISPEIDGKFTMTLMDGSLIHFQAAPDAKVLVAGFIVKGGSLFGISGG